jgi:type I restriction-modification system DNA methylase subunit
MAKTRAKNTVENRRFKRKPTELAEKNSATLGFEQKLWQAADKLRNNLDAAEYKHVVLGLIFLKYISDAFEEKRAALEAERKAGADPEDPDEYRAENIFWVPKVARWPHLQGKAKQPTVGKLVDDAMVAIERDNPTLKGTLPKDFARPALDKQQNGLGGRGKTMRNRKSETLFIDARKLGTMIDRVHRELTNDDIARIADTYHRWRGDGDDSQRKVRSWRRLLERI